LPFRQYLIIDYLLCRLSISPKKIMSAEREMIAQNHACLHKSRAFAYPVGGK
jgi:hypothetical protein